MNRLLRNPEIRRTLFFMLLITAVFSGGGFMVSFALGSWFLAGCAFLVAAFLLATARRYRRLEELCGEIDAVLHGKKTICFSDYNEGELYILQNEISKMTLRLSEQAQTLEKEKQFLSDTLADISHQLRSPLTSSQLIISLLQDPALSPERRSALLMELSRLLSHTGWLVEALLKMAKMDAGTAYLKKETVSVSQLLTRSAEPLLIPMELRGQELVRSFSSGEEQFTGDMAWSAEAVLNILKNCMEHTPENGTIWFFCRSTALYTEIRIEDNGSGFSPADIPHLFERFYKGQDASAQNAGIGLALSRMIITAQNGTIKAENRSEGGARFLIRFYRDGAAPGDKTVT